MRTRQMLAAGALSVAMWLGVPPARAAHTQVKPAPYASCLMRAALKSPYYSSTDDGDSAIALLHFCDNERFAWINECTAKNSNFCSLKSAALAMLTITLAEDARTGTH